MNRKSLQKQLDTAMSLYVRARDQYCVLCGDPQNLTNGHLFTRAAKSVRWDELNCHTQCYTCNMWHEEDQSEYTNWFIDRFGIARYVDLNRKYRTPHKYSLSELRDMLSTIKGKYDSLIQSNGDIDPNPGLSSDSFNPI